MIPLVREPSEFSSVISENCHFCRFPTRMWHHLTNNPVCQECAKTHKVSELPDHGRAIRAIARKNRKVAR